MFYCPSEEYSKTSNTAYKLDKDGIYYVANLSEYPYRLIFKPKSNLVFRIVMV